MSQGGMASAPYDVEDAHHHWRMSFFTFWEAEDEAIQFSLLDGVAYVYDSTSNTLITYRNGKEDGRQVHRFR